MIPIYHGYDLQSATQRAQAKGGIVIRGRSPNAPPDGDSVGYWSVWKTYLLAPDDVLVWPEPSDQMAPGTEDEYPLYDDVDELDDLSFADPGGRSALRAATPDNPRNLPCPTCGQPNRLTPADRARGYQCDACADRDEAGY